MGYMVVSPVPARTLKLSSAALPSRAARVEGWLEVQAPLFEVNLAQDQRDDFDWHFQLHHLGGGLCGQTRSSDQRIRRSVSTIADGDCDHIFVDYLADCRMIGEAAGKSVSAQSGDIVLFDMARPTTFDIAEPNGASKGWHTAFLMIPRTQFEASCDMRSLHGMVLKKESPTGQIIGAHLRALVAAAPTLEAGEAEALGKGTAAFLAQILGPASYRDEPDHEALTDATLLRVRHFIAAQLGRSDLSPNVIARECGISKAGLYRIFAPFEGVSSYVRGQRLLRARRELSSASYTHQTISAIARRNGFIDDASFRRAFRQAFGLSASDVRASKKSGRSPAILPDENAINAWIREL